MKNNYLLLLAVCCFNYATSQIINFPDANFKTKLMASSPTNNIAIGTGGYLHIDSNADGEIQVSEAEAIYGLNLSTAGISDLSGLEYFVNLYSLELWNNNVSTINLQAQTQLTFLNIMDNHVTDLNSIGAPNLTKMWFQNNLVTTIDFSNWPALEEVEGDNNPLTSLEIINHDILKIVSMKNCDITSLSLHDSPGLINVMVQNNEINDVAVSGLPIIVQLQLENNQISTIDLSQVPSMTQLMITNNLLTSLNLSAQHNLSFVGFNNNPNLQSLYLKNGAFEQFSAITGCPLLAYICNDQNQMATTQTAITAAGLLAHTNSYCSFVPGGEFYTVQGNIKVDMDTNGCDASDPDNAWVKFNVVGDNGLETFISNEGNYLLSLQSGHYAIDLSSENSFYTISPANIDFTLPEAENPVVQNICITPNGPHQDLEITILPIIPARPGFDATYRLMYRNKGTTTMSGTVDLTYQEPIVDFISSDTPVLMQSSGDVQFAFNDLAPLEKRDIYVTFNINSPMETPPVIAGQYIGFGATVLPVVGDEIYKDNFMGLKQIVVNSFDPNDKACLEGSTVAPDMIGEYVHYMIRFENTGTFAAQNIVVKDMIDTTKFDVSTLIPLSGSHPFETRLSDTNKVEFIFENIELPFDDANNDGYVAFKIKTLPSLVVGDTFSNSASIYFDYNFPIVTNTATTTIQQLQTSDFDFASEFTLYPVPTKNILNIQAKNGVEVKSVSIYNMLGQLLQVESGSVSAVDISALERGTYFLKIHSSKGNAVTRFVKE